MEEAEQNNFEQSCRIKGRFPGRELGKGIPSRFFLLSLTADIYQVLSMVHVVLRALCGFFSSSQPHVVDTIFTPFFYRLLN